MKKIWHDTAWEDYLYWQMQDKKTLKKVNRIIQSIERNGYQGIGKIEPLKEDLSGLFSARLDEKNRIVFRIDGEYLEIFQCRSHYGKG